MAVYKCISSFTSYRGKSYNDGDKITDFEYTSLMYNEKTRFIQSGQLFRIICPPLEQFDCNGKSLGYSDKIAVFYSPSIGRTRYYRQSLDKPQKGLKLLTFKSFKRAQDVCDITNKVSATDKFKVEEL